MILLVRVDDLCKSCMYFDAGNYECRCGNYLDGESEKFTVECDDYIEGCYENINIHTCKYCAYYVSDKCIKHNKEVDETDECNKWEYA